MQTHNSNNEIKDI